MVIPYMITNISENVIIPLSSHFSVPTTIFTAHTIMPIAGTYTAILRHVFVSQYLFALILRF